MTDRDLPVTEEWLRSIGAEEDRACNLWVGPAQWFDFPSGGQLLIDHHKGEFRLFTRGQVRLFCESLGVLLTETP